MLQIIDSLPEGLLDTAPHDLHERLGGPTLIHLEGRRPDPLFVSCLLHGNETTGWLAIQRLLRNLADRPLPRALSLLIGNTAAARAGLRRLDGQPDFNRIWKHGDTPEHQMARQVLDEMARRDVFAAVDIHNNTGLNPHYACVNVLDHRYLHLARLLGRTVVYFIQPDSVASLAFAGLCPSVTLECGQPGQAAGIEQAAQFLDAALHLSSHPVHPVTDADIDLFHTTAIVKVPADTSFSFSDEHADLYFPRDLERFNFRELAAGTLVGSLHPGSHKRLQAWDESGQDMANRYFDFGDDEIRLRVPVMPSMLTLDERVIRQDCLCYFMERYRVPGPG